MQSGKALREVAEEVWDWKDEESNHSFDTQGRKNRLQGTIRALVGGGIGLIVYVFGYPVLGSLILFVAGVTLAAASLSPTSIYPMIQELVVALQLLVRKLLTFLSLVFLFYAFFVPFGLLFRRGKKDPMERWTHRPLDSYWKKGRTLPCSLSSYKRQF